MFFQNIFELDSSSKQPFPPEKLKFYVACHTTKLGKWLSVTDSNGRLWKISYLGQRSPESAANATKKDLGLPSLEWADTQNEKIFKLLWKNWNEGSTWSEHIKIGLLGSTFERTIWRTLIQIPSGTTVSYGELGEIAGFGKHTARAVGGAMGRNHLMLIVPCHRVISSNGSLGGFQWGPTLKTQLLDHERSIIVESSSL